MLVIEKDKIEELKKELAKKMPVFDATKKALPPKQYFLPGSEETFTYNVKKRKAKAAPVPKPFIVFGLALRDTEALIQLDQIMRGTPPSKASDFFYFQKRDAATIVSIIEEAGTVPQIGVDLILEQINDNQYKALALTDKGKKITKSKYFKKIKNANRKENEKNEWAAKLRELLIDPELLKDAVKWSWRGYPEIWEKLGKQCLSCGICTYVCPLCYCFSMEDTCSLDQKTCTKTRKWTACTLPEFSRVTGGHNFHKTIKERYYNWFYHKFVRGYNEYGKSLCVACGRCGRFCPAGINIGEVLTEIVKSYQSKRPV